MSRAVLAATAAAALSAFALAPTSAKAADLAYGNFDTRGGGSFGLVSTPTNDGNGSLQLQTTNAPPIAGVNQDKVSVIFGTGSPLGALADLAHLDVAFFKETTGVTAKHQFAYRLHLSNGDTLVWENEYNANTDLANGVWTSLDLAGGNFWLYDGANHNGGGDAVSLNDWVNGTNIPTDVGSTTINSTTQVLGLEIASGSGLGAFTGYVDDLSLDFGSAQFSADLAVAPLPSSAAAGLALCAAFGALQLRKRLSPTKTA